jgi:hypothetical protein
MWAPNNSPETRLDRVWICNFSDDKLPECLRARGGKECFKASAHIVRPSILIISRKTWKKIYQISRFRVPRHWHVVDGEGEVRRRKERKANLKRFHGWLVETRNGRQWRATKNFPSENSCHFLTQLREWAPRSAFVAEREKRSHCYAKTVCVYLYG